MHLQDVSDAPLYLLAHALAVVRDFSLRFQRTAEPAIPWTHLVKALHVRAGSSMIPVKLKCTKQLSIYLGVLPPKIDSNDVFPDPEGPIMARSSPGAQHPDTPERIWDRKPLLLGLKSLNTDLKLKYWSTG